MTKSATRVAADEVSAPIASPVFTGNVGINNSSPTQRLETNGNAQFNMYDNPSGAGGYYTTKGLQIGNAFDAGLSGGDDDRNAIVWNERGTSLLFGTNNIEHMRINADGIVTKPLQPAFQARVTSNLQNLPINGQYVIPYGTERFDQNSDFNPSTYTFTAPVTGKYQLNGTVYLNNVVSANGYVEFYIITSNEIYYSILSVNGFDTDLLYFTMPHTVLADMDAGDTAKCAMWLASGSQTTDLRNDSFFSGYLVA